MSRKNVGRPVTFEPGTSAAGRAAEEARRGHGEQVARGYTDGRRERRRNRTVQVGLKISEVKREQFGRLRQLTELSYTEIFEAALDAFEREWKAQHGQGQRN